MPQTRVFRTLLRGKLIERGSWESPIVRTSQLRNVVAVKTVVVLGVVVRLRLVVGFKVVVALSFVAHLEIAVEVVPQVGAAVV